MMNRRDFLKFLGSLPLIGLVTKLPAVKEQTELDFDGMTTADISLDDLHNADDFELGWHMVFNDDTGELRCVEVNLAELMQTDLADGWTHVTFPKCDFSIHEYSSECGDE